MYIANNRNESHIEIGLLNILITWMSLLLLLCNCFGILVVQSVLEISKSCICMITKA